MKKKLHFTMLTFLRNSLMIGFILFLGGEVNAQTVYRFDGIDDYATVTENGDGVLNDFSAPADFTVEVRFRYHAIPSGNAKIVSKHSSPGNGFFIEFVSGSTNLKVGMGRGGSGFQFQETTSELTINTWYTAALVFNQTAGAFSFYLDGTLVGSEIILTPSYFPDTNNPIAIGKSFFFQEPSPIDVDFLRIWTDQQSPVDLSANQSMELDCASTNLLLQYRFDEPSGSTIAMDCTAGSNDGEYFGAQKLVPLGNECSDAIDINDLFSTNMGDVNTSSLYDNTNYTSEVSDPDITAGCFFSEDVYQKTIWYSFTGNGGVYNIKSVECNATNYITDGDTQVAIYTGDCMSPVFADCNDDENPTLNFNIDFVTEIGVEYRMLVDGYGGLSGEFCLQVTNLMEAPGLPADECSDAFDINPLFGQAVNVAQTSGIWDNTNYTSESSDPTTGFECFGEPDGGGGGPSLERTIWYSFTGDGGTYKITTVECNATNYIGDGDTQMAVYSGNCMNPVAVECGEDTDANNFAAVVEMETEDGVDYLVMIDGFGPDFEQMGEYCVEVTLLDPNSVTNITKTNIQIFPNPTTGLLQMENVEADAVEVFDNTGRLVKIVAQPGNQMNISELATGFYFLRITEKDAVYSARIIKE